MCFTIFYLYKGTWKWEYVTEPGHSKYDIWKLIDGHIQINCSAKLEIYNRVSIIIIVVEPVTLYITDIILMSVLVIFYMLTYFEYFVSEHLQLKK